LLPVTRHLPQIKNKKMSDLNIVSLAEWGLGLERPVIISGPCSAETEEQMMSPL
jgi:3-deoxy-D-arabino-heptulosonate 7-phosphate (DAHP) synthase